MILKSYKGEEEFNFRLFSIDTKKFSVFLRLILVPDNNEIDDNDLEFFNNCIEEFLSPYRVNNDIYSINNSINELLENPKMQVIFNNNPKFKNLLKSKIMGE